MKIKTKSTIFLLLLLTSTVIFIGYFVFTGVKSYQQTNLEELLSKEARFANMYIRQAFLLDGRENIFDYLNAEGEFLSEKLSEMSGMPITIYSMNKDILGSSSKMNLSLQVDGIIDYALKNQIVYQTIGDRMDYLVPIKDFRGQVAVIQFTHSLKNNREFYENLKRIFISTSSIILTISLFAGYTFLNKFTSRILKLKKDASYIEEGLYDRVSSSINKDEIGDLSITINRMGSTIKKQINKLNAEQNKLNLAINKLEKLELKQKEFIGNISHEFKTPLTVIKAYLDLINMYPDDDKLNTEAREIIKKEAARLENMVERVLDLSELEKYDFELNNRKVEIHKELKEIFRRLNGKAKKFNITMKCKTEKANIYGDRDWINQIMINLIDNSIKYNIPGGEIIISNYTVNNEVIILVEDTGIGIPEEIGDKIFEPFYRVNKDRSRSTGGTGLGLALVKSLVEKQGGSVSILQKDSRGSIFQVKFPAYK